MPSEPCLACRGDIAYVNLLKQERMSVVGRIERTQGLFVGTSCGRLITERVVRAAATPPSTTHARICSKDMDVPSDPLLPRRFACGA